MLIFEPKKENFRAEWKRSQAKPSPVVQLEPWLEPAWLGLITSRYLAPVVALADYVTFSPYCSNQIGKNYCYLETYRKS